MGSLRPQPVVWLVLVICTSITICALGATPMFTDCSNINSGFGTSSGGDFEAIGCNYPSAVTTISLDSGAGTTVTAYIAYGRVAAGASASLWVQCPADAISKSLSITVTGIAFGQDASFRFTGALPAHSSLHISNNTFYLTKWTSNNFQDPTNSANSYTTAILVGGWGIALVLEEGTAMSAVNNTVTCRWAGVGTERVVAVAVIGASATLKSMSNLSMSGNSIINSRSSGNAHVAYLHLYSYGSSRLTLHNQSAIAMSGNVIVNSSFSGSATAYVAYFYLDCYNSDTSLTLHNQSAIAMSGNRILGSSFSGSAYVAYLYLYSPTTAGSSILTLCNQSAIAMNGNTIMNSSFSGIACVAYLYLDSYSYSSRIFLANQSAIAMSYNGITNSSFSSFSGGAYVAWLLLYSVSSSSSLTIYDQSAIVMRRNSIINCSSSSNGGSVFIALLRLTSYGGSSGSGSVTLYNRSTIAVSDNSIIKSSFGSITGSAYVAFQDLYSTSDGSLTLYNQSTIAISGNSIIGSSFSNSAYVAYVYLSGSSISLTLYNQSDIAICDNGITNSSFSGVNTYVAYLYLYSSSSRLTLYNRSAIAMSGNSHSQVRASLVVIEVIGPITLKSLSSITMERNSVWWNNVYVSYGLLAFLRISAWSISLNDSSSISTNGNGLQGPALGQGAQVASLLTISSSNGNGASSVLSISGGSSLAVTLNDIIAGAMALNVAMKVSAEFPSTIAIVDNHVSGGYVSWLANFSGGFHLNGMFLASGNRVEAQNQIAGFSLVNIASGFTNGSMSSVQACGNNLSWVGSVLAPKLYLQPTLFASLAAKCLTPTSAPLTSQSVSPSASVSETSSAGSMSPTIPMTYSSSHDPCTSFTFSASKSATESLSHNGSSETLSRSVSNTSNSMTTQQQYLSKTVEPTNSLANCDICHFVKVASDQSALFDTCTEPGQTETAAKDSAYVPLAKFIGDAAKQAAIQSTYNGPALQSGNSFSYGSVVLLWPEGMANVTQVAAASPSLAACWVHARSANATEICVAVEALTVAADSALNSASAPVVLMALSLNVSCGAAAVVFNRTIAMERPVVYLPKKAFVPGKAVQDTATTSGALSVTVGAVAVPIAAMQQGVALALLRMAQCEEDALNGEPLDVSVHPLQFGLGAGSGKYGRGALVGNLLVVPAIWCALMYLLVPFGIRALTDRTLDASRDFVGWPGMGLMPLAVLSEGSAMASIGLLTQGSVEDIIMGLVGLAILLVTTACWAAELWRMRPQVVLSRASGVESWAKAIHPRFEWEVGKKKHEGNAVAITSYLDKRIQLVGSSWWLWSALAAHVLSMVVGVAESLPVSSGMCRVRWAVASLAAVLQAAAVMTNTVPVELLLLGAIGAMSCILVVLIALSTFDVGSPGSNFSALNAVGMVNSILGIALLGIGACTGAYEIFTQRSRRALSARMYSQFPATPLSLLSVPMIPQQQVSPPPVATSLPTSEELPIEMPQRGWSSRYTDIPAQWASILDDADLAATERELASGCASLL